MRNCKMRFTSTPTNSSMKKFFFCARQYFLVLAFFLCINDFAQNDGNWYYGLNYTNHISFGGYAPLSYSPSFFFRKNNTEISLGPKLIYERIPNQKYVGFNLGFKHYFFSSEKRLRPFVFMNLDYTFYKTRNPYSYTDPITLMPANGLGVNKYKCLEIRTGFGLEAKISSRLSAFAMAGVSNSATAMTMYNYNASTNQLLSVRSMGGMLQNRRWDFYIGSGINFRLGKIQKKLKPLSSGN